MPSTQHELLVALVRDTAKSFLPIVLPPVHSTSAWWDQNANMTMPNPVERRADLLLLDHPVRPTYGVIVEVQLQWDDRKTFTFPLYQMAARDRHRCPVHCLLVTPSASIAARFAEPIDLGGGWMWKPSVFGPDEAWSYLDRFPPDSLPPDLLVLLGGIAGTRDDGRIARALFSAACAVDSALDPDYAEWALGALSSTGARVFKELLMNAKSTTDPNSYKNPLFLWLMEVGQEKGREEARSALLEVAAVFCAPERCRELERLDDLGALRDAIRLAAIEARAEK